MQGRQLRSSENLDFVLRTLEAKVEGQCWGSAGGVLEQAGRNRALGSQGERYQVLPSGCALESSGREL